MASVFNPPPPALVLTPDLYLALKERSLELLDHIIRTNSQTTFFRESNTLSTFRGLLTDGWPSDAATLHSQFKEAVPFSNYEDYRPFVERLLVPHCEAKSVQDLLSPGLPEFIAKTSGTSGSGPKFFPKYDHPIFRSPPRLANYSKSDSLSTCALYSMHKAIIIDIALDDGAVKRLPITSIASGGYRLQQGITIGNEDEMANHKPKSSVSPFAVLFLPSELSIILMHLIFAIADSSLGTLTCLYSTIMHDAIRLMEDNWDVMVEAVEKGAVPELVEVGQYREALEEHLKPNPSRAGELRQITKGSLGWLREIWPKLDVVRTNASGIHALPIPKLRHHFGLDVTIMTRYWGSTECSIATAYDASDLNLYSMTPHEFFEFLDVSKPENSEHLSQFWELEVGKRYELVATTREGLWRYRHGDVVEVAGFTPDSGQPLLRFVERRGCTFRIWAEFVSEKRLMDGILSLGGSLGRAVEFTAFQDDRRFPRCYGFFVELEGEIGPDAKDAIDILYAHLSREDGYKYWTGKGCIGKPTIQIVSKGVFQLYRSNKAASAGMPVAQMKVPVATADRVLIDWLWQRVILEIVA